MHLACVVGAAHVVECFPNQQRRCQHSAPLETAIWVAVWSSSGVAQIPSLQADVVERETFVAHLDMFSFASVHRVDGYRNCCSSGPSDVATASLTGLADSAYQLS